MLFQLKNTKFGLKKLPFLWRSWACPNRFERYQQNNKIAVSVLSFLLKIFLSYYYCLGAKSYLKWRFQILGGGANQAFALYLNIFFFAEDLVKTFSIIFFCFIEVLTNFYGTISLILVNYSPRTKIIKEDVLNYDFCESWKWILVFEKEFSIFFSYFG